MHDSHQGQKRDYLLLVTSIRHLLNPGTLDIHLRRVRSYLDKQPDSRTIVTSPCESPVLATHRANPFVSSGLERPIFQIQVVGVRDFRAALGRWRAVGHSNQIVGLSTFRRTGSLMIRKELTTIRGASASAAPATRRGGPAVVESLQAHFRRESCNSGADSASDPQFPRARPWGFPGECYTHQPTGVGPFRVRMCSGEGVGRGPSNAGPSTTNRLETTGDSGTVQPMGFRPSTRSVRAAGSLVSS
jgi:hypothetical protein